MFVFSVLEGGKLYKFVIISKDPVYLSVFCYLLNLTVVILSHLGAVK